MSNINDLTLAGGNESKCKEMELKDHHNEELSDLGN